MRVARLQSKPAKLLAAMLVFGAILAGWFVAVPLYRDHMPLPGADGPSGRCAVWFVGSSTVARWTTLEADLAPWKVRNRGVNSILIPEIHSRWNAERNPGPGPGTIVFYAGENDMAKGSTAEQTAGYLAQFLDDVARRYPATQIAVIALKPTPARWRYRSRQLRYDALVRRLAASRPTVRFIPIGNALLRNGVPDPRFYVADGIHLTPQGYAVWDGELRQELEAGMSQARRLACEPAGR